MGMIQNRYLIKSLELLQPVADREPALVLFAGVVRLHALLDDALEHDVTLLTAPAGYGKSTLAVDWASAASLPVAWLSLDAQDSDPLALVADLVGAVRQAFPDTLVDLVARLEAGGVPAGAGALIAELTAGIQAEVDDLFVLVLDDLHVLDGVPEALAVVDTLIRSVPMNLRIMVLSRTWPALGSLARLTAQRRAFSLTARDLTFTAEEAARFLEQSRVGNDDRDELIRRADGWAAALAVMVDHYEPERGIRGEFEFILGQFIDQEVLERLSPLQLDLLSACAVLPTFDQEFAIALTRDEGAAPALHELAQTNRFLTHLGEASGDGDWYRMHALVREHLLGRMEREQRARLMALRRQAAALCARRGLMVEAVNLSIDAHDWPEVVRELHDTREALYQRGEWRTLAGWIDQLPDEVLEGETDLALARARLAAKFGHRQESMERLDKIESRPLSPDQQIRTLLYRSVALRDLGRMPDALDCCRRARQMALEHLDDDDPILAEVALEEGIALGRSGQLPAAQARLEDAAIRFERQNDQHSSAEARDTLGNATYLMGDLAVAMMEYTSAQRRWRMLANPQAQIATMNNMGNVQHMLGELETARDTFEAVIERAARIGHHRYEAYGKEGLAGVERDLGRLDNAITLYTVAIHEAQEIDDPNLILAATFGLAMCYRERGEMPRARTLLEHGLRSAEQTGALLQQTRFRAGIGATLSTEHGHAEALPLLEQALEEAEESGARREQALTHLLIASAQFHLRRRQVAVEHLERVWGLTETLGYDQFLLVEARQAPEVIEHGAARRVGGEYFRTLAVRIRPKQEGSHDAEMPAAFRIRAEAFGAPRVSVDGRMVADLEWRSERSKELFFYLLHRGRPLRKEEIAVELWPDVSPKQLNSQFHTTLYRLRQAIHPQVVVQSGGGYQVNPDFDIWYDAAEFERGIQQAETAPTGSEEWASGVSKVIQLYHGSFAASFESDWAEAARLRYEEMYLSSNLALATAALRRSDPVEAIRMAESVLAVDPVNEDAAYLVMDAHARRGNLDMAARAYRRLHDAMSEEDSGTPSRRVRALYERVISGDALDDPSD